MPCTAAEPPEKLLKTLVSGPNLASGLWLPPDGPSHGTAVPHPTEGAVPVPPSPCWELLADGELPGPEPIPLVRGGIFWERRHRAPAAAVDGEGIKDLEELAELPRGACQGLQIHPCSFLPIRNYKMWLLPCWKHRHLQFLAGGALVAAPPAAPHHVPSRCRGAPMPHGGSRLWGRDARAVPPVPVSSARAGCCTPWRLQGWAGGARPSLGSPLG